MPFDGFDPEKFTLEGGAALLRHREHWPEGFYWDYKSITTCALGLFHHVWGDEVFGPAHHNPVFYMLPVLLGKPASMIQPEDVADAIDLQRSDPAWEKVLLRWAVRTRLGLPSWFPGWLVGLFVSRAAAMRLRHCQFTSD